MEMHFIADKTHPQDKVSVDQEEEQIHVPSNDVTESLAAVTNPQDDSQEISQQELTVDFDEEQSAVNGSIEDRAANGTQEDGEEPSLSKSNVSSSESVSDDSVSSASKASCGGSPPKKRKKSDKILPTGTNPRLSHPKLKKTMAPFVQTKPCDKLLKIYVGKCLECKYSRRFGKRNKDICRFVGFRKLRYTERGKMTVAGFPDVKTAHYTDDDLKLWMPEKIPADMSRELAKFLIQVVGDQFCELVKQEKEFIVDHENQENQNLIWRRVIQGLRELCDVCSTTLFNYHWTCGKCGFVACVSCFKARKNMSTPVLSHNENSEETKDEYGWLKCHLKGGHKIEELMLTQIIAGKALDTLWTKLHQLRISLKIPQVCGCAEATDFPSTNGDSVQNILKTRADTEAPEQDSNGTLEQESLAEDKPGSEENQGGIVEFICDKNGVDANTTQGDEKTVEDSDDDDMNGIMDFMSSEHSDSVPGDSTQDCENVTQDSIVKSSESEPVNTSQENLRLETEAKEIELKNFIRQGSSTYTIKTAPKKIISFAESSRLYPTVPHAWLCQGRLLQLLDTTNPGNLQMFQEQWKRGQPVIVSNVASKLDEGLWTPESFSRDFGQKTNHLINCMTGKIVPSQKMKKFWDGFVYMKNRLRDENDVPMLLKLKDWPPGDDFAEMLPNRFKDLMTALPLGEYTHRDGKLNLAARLPDIFSKPDLGPKMYIAYGSGLHLDKGTTNLHLDISDAINVMVYLGVVKDDDLTAHNNAIIQAIEESDCDTLTINRVHKKNELPGALWHIWEAKDADKIRDLLNKVAVERGQKLERYHDAIHDQSWYLDRKLRKRLMSEYNVMGYPILQCAGDAVFIPAGAPHQVRNLNNCIKIAEDFVSPENVRHCFHLTEEFRNLTDTHTNHEDKLQIKNIVYHTVKDAVAVIEASTVEGQLEGN